MIHKFHDLEAHYLHRRLEFLQKLDSLVHQSLEEQDFHISHDWRLEILEKEYSDVRDPSSLCKTIERIYPPDLFQVRSK